MARILTTAVVVSDIEALATAKRTQLQTLRQRMTAFQQDTNITNTAAGDERGNEAFKAALLQLL
jgi:hypothetical protein